MLMGEFTQLVALSRDYVMARHNLESIFIQTQNLIMSILNSFEAKISSFFESWKALTELELCWGIVIRGERNTWGEWQTMVAACLQNLQLTEACRNLRETCGNSSRNLWFANNSCAFKKALRQIRIRRTADSGTRASSAGKRTTRKWTLPLPSAWFSSAWYLSPVRRESEEVGWAQLEVE